MTAQNLSTEDILAKPPGQATEGDPVLGIIWFGQQTNNQNRDDGGSLQIYWEVNF